MDSKSEPFFERLILAVMVGAAVAAFAVSAGQPWAWAFELPCAASLFFRIRIIPRLLRVWATYLAWALVGLTVSVGLVLHIFPVLSTRTVTALTLIGGYGLAFSSTLFLLGACVWPPASSLFPATLGLLLAAAFNPEAPLRAELAVTGAAAFGYLAAARNTTVEVRKQLALTTVQRFTPLALSALGTFLVASAIIFILPWTQTQVEQGTIRFFPVTSQGYSSLTSQSRLGDLEELKLSQKIALRVWTSRPQKLRGRVFTNFDGWLWQVPLRPAAALSPASPGMALDPSVKGGLEEIPGSLFFIPRTDRSEVAGANTISTKIVQVSSNQGMAVAPGDKVVVRLPVSALRLDAFENLVPSAAATVQIYGVINRRQGDVVQRDASSAAELAACLALPATTDARLKELSAQLSAGNPSATARISRTLEYLQSHCRYSLHVGQFHSQQPVAEFLFEKKQGYCEYFASAAVVLLRLEGVPSRYVTGFNVQEGNRQGDHYVVRAADAHAWVEAFLPEQGWVEIDPTPEAEYAALHAAFNRGWLAGAKEWVAAKLAELSARFGEGDWLAAFRWVWGQLRGVARWMVTGGWRFGWPFLVLVAVVVVWWRRRRTPASGTRLSKAQTEKSPAVPSEIAELILRLDHNWARQGFARPPSRAPLEHLALIPVEEISTSLRDTSSRVIDYVYRTCFGNMPFVPSEARELRASLEQEEEAAGRARGGFFGVRR